MNQTLLTRLFKTIDGNPNDPLVKVAFSIIEDEKKKGHETLAEKLGFILEGNLARKHESYPIPVLKIAKSTSFNIPSDRRYKIPLATLVEREELRHDMVLSSEIEEKVSRIENEYVARERLAHHGLKPRQKILFYGVPGCGKSMAAERIAWNIGLPFYKVRFDAIISSYLGESAVNLKKLFDALKDFPCVLLLDEFDVVGKARSNKDSEVGEMHRIVNILLGLLEEYDSDGLLIATTNLEGSLDKALFRRFDDIIQMPKPTNKEIESLLIMAFSALKLSKTIEIPALANKMNNLSAALVVKIANNASKFSIINNEKEITLAHIEKALVESSDFNQ
jgi:SpoVK/Ycf46/Vps4 family AAA+-type ATPase